MHIMSMPGTASRMKEPQSRRQSLVQPAARRGSKGYQQECTWGATTRALGSLLQHLPTVRGWSSLCKTYTVSAGDSAKSPGLNAGILKDSAMNSTSPGLHVDLLPPHIKEEQNGLGVLRNCVSPGRAPGRETGRLQITSSSTTSAATAGETWWPPQKPCCRYGSDRSSLIFSVWFTGGRGQQNWALETHPTALGKPLHPRRGCHRLCSHLHHAQLQRI